MNVGVDIGFATLDNMEKPIGGRSDHVAPIPIAISLASIAVSLRRIASHFERSEVTYTAAPTRPGDHVHNPLHVKITT